MIHSMTGFGRASAKCKYGIITVEIKSLNHKFFDTSIKLPNGLAGFEDRAKKIFQKNITRGKLYVNVTFDDKLNQVDKISIDVDAARAYKRHLAKLKKALGLKGDIKLDQFIALPGVISYEAPKIEAEKVWVHVRKVLTRAVAGLLLDRGKEGKALQKDLAKRVRGIKKLLVQIGKRSSINVGNYKRHLSKRIKELTGSEALDKGRLEQEVAIFAKNCDITEELTRMKSHLSAFEESLRREREIGKKLDFIAQELHREINTVGAKASDAQIAKNVIQIKSEIEKIREQVKNIQ